MLKYRNVFIGGKNALFLIKKEQKDIADLVNDDGDRLVLIEEVGSRYNLPDNSYKQGYVLCGSANEFIVAIGLILIDLSNDGKCLDLTLEFTEQTFSNMPRKEYQKVLAHNLDDLVKYLGQAFFSAKEIHLHILNDIPFRKNAVETNPTMAVLDAKRNYVVMNPYHAYMPTLVSEMDAFDTFYQDDHKVFKRITDEVFNCANLIDDKTLEEYKDGTLPNQEVFNTLNGIIFDQEYGEKPVNIVFGNDGEMVYNHYHRLVDSRVDDGSYETINTHICYSALNDDAKIEITINGHGDIAILDTSSTVIVKKGNTLQLETDYFPDGEDALINYELNLKTGDAFYRGRIGYPFSNFATEICYQVGSDGKIKSVNVDFNNYKAYGTRQERVKGSYMLRIKPDSVKLFYAHRRGTKDDLDATDLISLLSATGEVTDTMIDGIIEKAIAIINSEEERRDEIAADTLLSYPNEIKLDNMIRIVSKINEMLASLKDNLPASRLHQLLDTMTLDLRKERAKTYL